MKPARQREVRVQPDGGRLPEVNPSLPDLPSYEVRLVLRYEDGPEREQAKGEGFLWDVPLKEWYARGLDERGARKVAEYWQRKIDAIPHDRSAAPYRHAKRTTEPSAEFEFAQAVAHLRGEIAGLKDLVRELEEAKDQQQTRAEEAEIALLARKEEPGLYKATCPGCGEDVFVEVKEAERI